MSVRSDLYLLQNGEVDIPFRKKNLIDIFLKVYSDGKLCPDYKERGVGFRIKYDVETGTC